MNIALIALSGVRACDDELLKLGLTLPGFVERSRTIASLPSLGLLTLAGMTPKRHRVSYIEVADLKQAEGLPVDFDLVAISTFTAQAKEAYALARRFTDRGIPVVMGGLHVTCCPEEPGQQGIIAAVGEGETTWPRILADAEAGTLKPIYDARGEEFDLAQAPMPAYELLDITRYNRLTVQTSRGCPWRCAFCASSILMTQRYKQKPVEKVLMEIDRIRSLWPRPFIEFADDNAFVHRAWWRAFLPELARRRIKWFAESDLSIAQDEPLLELMRRSGCAEVLIGFESPTPAGLGGIELRRDWKRHQYPRYRAAIERIQSRGIRVNACFIIGLDGHTPAVFEDVLEFVEQTLPYDVQVTYPTPFPGTPMYQRLLAEGRLIEPRAWEKCTLFDLNFHPSPMTATQLRAGFLELVRRLYSDEATRHRRAHFRAISHQRGARTGVLRDSGKLAEHAQPRRTPRRAPRQPHAGTMSV